jgi:hypothetical protein
LYAVWFTCVGIWGYIGLFFTVSNKVYDALGRHFWITIMTAIFFPLQGFFNFFIFIRPRYLSIRQGPCEGQGRWFAFREAVWYPVETRPSLRASRASARLSHNRESFSAPMGQKSKAEKSSALSQTANDSEILGRALRSDRTGDDNSQPNPQFATSNDDDELERVADGLSESQSTQKSVRFASPTSGEPSTNVENLILDPSTP